MILANEGHLQYWEWPLLETITQPLYTIDSLVITHFNEHNLLVRIWSIHSIRNHRWLNSKFIDGKISYVFLLQVSIPVVLSFYLKFFYCNFSRNNHSMLFGQIFLDNNSNSINCMAKNESILCISMLCNVQNGKNIKKLENGWKIKKKARFFSFGWDIVINDWGKLTENTNCQRRLINTTPIHQSAWHSK